MCEREFEMMKPLLGSFALTTLLAIAPASAQTGAMMDCTDANMTKASADMDKMPAGEKKTMAMKEMTMAKDMMAKKDMAECKTHMNKAMEMGMSK
jgi:hypothetical protein